MDYQKEFNDIATGAITREAAIRKVHPTAVQLLMYLKLHKKKYKTAFKFMQNFESNAQERELDFKDDILGVKIDFKGKSFIVPMFIRKILMKMAERNKINYESVRGVIAIHELKPYVFLYNDNRKVKMLTAEEIFSDEIQEEVVLEQMQEAAEEQMDNNEP